MKHSYLVKISLKIGHIITTGIIPLPRTQRGVSNLRTGLGSDQRTTRMMFHENNRTSHFQVVLGVVEGGSKFD